MTDDTDPESHYDDLDATDDLIAYGVVHRIEMIEGRLVLVETSMAQYRGQDAEVEEDEIEILELEELPETWINAVLQQGAELEEGETVYFQYPDEDEDEDLPSTYADVYKDDCEENRPGSQHD